MELKSILRVNKYCREVWYVKATHSKNQYHNKGYKLSLITASIILSFLHRSAILEKRIVILIYNALWNHNTPKKREFLRVWEIKRLINCRTDIDIV